MACSCGSCLKLEKMRKALLLLAQQEFALLWDKVQHPPQEWSQEDVKRAALRINALKELEMACRDDE